MQITQQSFSQSPNQAWQYSQKEPVVIGDDDEKRVLISYAFYQKLLAQYQQTHKTNAERLGMSLEDLALAGDVEFDRVHDLPKEIDL
ncbi:hypothetical protein B0181_08510 [Moraxella caviae]|uniref:Antitoxin n=1 Tax=Moraxella caviae TaxID=34060 RepID=A0A1S9ZXK9_9GAMM|nr:hypothetical protein [Moraxella caviae]OOR88272.1 hypothetical protein B0181_08510 [Moraxella caviae]STZ13892.1 Uncharacterised protein [Moraxella caviae]